MAITVMKKSFLHVLIILGTFQLPNPGEAITCYECYAEALVKVTDPSDYGPAPPAPPPPPYVNCWLDGGLPISTDPANPISKECDSNNGYSPDHCLLEITLNTTKANQNDLSRVDKGCVSQRLLDQFKNASISDDPKLKFKVNKTEDCYVMDKAFYEYYKAIASGSKPGAFPKEENITIAYCWCMKERCNDLLTDTMYKAVNLKNKYGTGGNNKGPSSDASTNSFQWTAFQLVVVKILVIKVGEALHGSQPNWFWNIDT